MSQEFSSSTAHMFFPSLGAFVKPSIGGARAKSGRFPGLVRKALIASPEGTRAVTMESDLWEKAGVGHTLGSAVSSSFVLSCPVTWHPSELGLTLCLLRDALQVCLLVSN